MTEREIFLRHLQLNPYDRESRLIFADWLDDHDEPEMCDLMRSWTKEKQKGAEDLLSRYLKRIKTGETCCEYDEIDQVAEDHEYDRSREYYQDWTISTIVEKALEYHDSKGSKGSIGIVEDLPDEWSGEQAEKDFWQAISILANRPLQNMKVYYGMFWCSC